MAASVAPGDDDTLFNTLQDWLLSPTANTSPNISDNSSPLQTAPQQQIMGDDLSDAQSKKRRLQNVVATDYDPNDMMAFGSATNVAMTSSVEDWKEYARPGVDNHPLFDARMTPLYVNINYNMMCF